MGLQVCAPWATPADLCFTPGGDTTDCETGSPTPLVYKWDPEVVIMAVSNILYIRTGRRYPGVCERDPVWPCVAHCWSDRHECVPCCNLSTIILPSDYPVVEITEISEDGVELDPDAYRLERNRVIRMDGEGWKRNSFGLPCADNLVETIVTYTAGVAPPPELVMATAALTDELLKSCNGQTCALPANVTSFSRRGMTVELTDLAELLKSGATGIPIVDHALAAHVPLANTMTMTDPAARYRGGPVVT